MACYPGALAWRRRRRDLARRFAELDDELSDMPNNDYVVYNRHGEIEQTVQEIEEIIRKERHNPARPPARLRI